MRERPILFNGPMVRAVLAGTKTQTRRIMKPQPHPDFLARGLVAVTPQWPLQDGVRFFMADGTSELVRCPYGAPGDRLWVRERMRVVGVGPSPRAGVRLRYEADGEERDVADWPARLALPQYDKCLAYGGHREASRITIDVLSVRAERLQGITEEDIAAESVTRETIEEMLGREVSNPWVWVVSFARRP